MAALTNQELTDEIKAIISLLNQVQIAITNLASQKQLIQLNFINQQAINDLKERMDAAEASLSVLKSKV